MYAVNWSNRAKKQLRKIDRKEQMTIIDTVDALEDFPNTKNVIPLTKHKYGYRLRVGNYRILFDADTAVRVIEIQQVKKREEQRSKLNKQSGANCGLQSHHFGSQRQTGLCCASLR